MKRAIWVGALMVALITTSAGCAGPTGAIDPENVPTELSRAMPAVETATPSLSGAAPSCQNAASSYDPLAKLPASADFTKGSTLAEIRDRGRLIVGTAGDKRLLSVRDPRTGDLEGIDIEIAKAVAKAILGDPEAIEFRTITYGDRERVLVDDEVDMVAHSMTMTCDRWTRVASRPSTTRTASACWCGPTPAWPRWKTWPRPAAASAWPRAPPPSTSCGR